MQYSRKVKTLLRVIEVNRNNILTINAGTNRKKEINSVIITTVVI